MLASHLAFASLLSVATPGGLGPSASDSLGFDPASPVALAVRDSVARRWSVGAGQIELAWGPIRDEWRASAPASISLLGSGAGGYWVVSYPGPGGADIRIRVRAGVAGEHAVAARDLDREAVLTAEDIRIEREVAWGAPAAELATAEPGWVTHRVMHEGQPLRAPAVTRPLAVRSGDPVQAVWRRGGIVMVLQGRAAGSASIGEHVYVRTSDGQRYRGIAESPGRVLLDNGAPRK